MRLFGSISLAAVLLSGLAHAADLPSRRAPILTPVPVAHWDGFYAGTFLTLGQARFDSYQTAGRSVSDFGSNMGALASAPILLPKSETERPAVWYESNRAWPSVKNVPA